MSYTPDKICQTGEIALQIVQHELIPELRHETGGLTPKLERVIHTLEWGRLEVFVQAHLGEQLIGHLSRDAIAIAVRERPDPKRQVCAKAAPGSPVARQRQQMLSQMLPEIPAAWFNAFLMAFTELYQKQRVPQTLAAFPVPGWC